MATRLFPASTRSLGTFLAQRCRPAFGVQGSD